MAKFKTSKTWAKRNLKAVDKLIDEYKGKSYHVWCPLCIAAKDNCDKCPWVVFGRGICDIEANFRSDPIPSRLHRLYGWRVRLKNIIKGGKP